MNDTLMMRRALCLAKNGEGRVSPNPMVGAVITARGRIIGEGYHRHWGGPHAEVNAIASVRPADRPLLREATMYVTLEPCSHYGKTPPCSRLIIETGIPRVAVAIADPFPEVSGRGIAMLREAGIEVSVGLLEKEARDLNRRFITAHTLGRPYIQLKWARSADGFIAGRPGSDRIILSNPLTMVLMHRERALADAIMTGTGTILADNPRLDCRLWPGRTPAAATFDSPRLPADTPIRDGRTLLLRNVGETLPDFLHRIYRDHKITSLMVEGGAVTLQEFIDMRLFDEIRTETSPILVTEGVKEPSICHDDVILSDIFTCRDNILRVFRRIFRQ